MTLMEFAVCYVESNVKLSDDGAAQVFINVRCFERHCQAKYNTVFELAAIKKEHVVSMMKDLVSKGRSPRTANNKRSTVLTLLREAAEQKLCAVPGKIKRAEEPKRAPRAWSPQQVAEILQGCDGIKWPQDWTAADTKALCMVIYDTSHRIGALLKADRDQLDASGRLHLYAEQTKQTADTVHTLHRETLAAIKACPRRPRSKKLFPWPLHQRRIYVYLRRLLEQVGLPAGRRDLFHKLRRTSYTLVWATSGQDAASTHAGHSTDLHRAYLDIDLARSIRGDKNPIDLMPRPAVA